MTRQEIRPERLGGTTVVVLDVFMATTTLLTILENGARGVFPAESLQEADRAKDGLDASSLLRGGEQGAARIEGYDHGPFPEEYAPEVVRDKDVIFVTTNGTRAIADAAPAQSVLLGCLRNAPAVARFLQESNPDSIYLVCAGSAGRFPIEDFLGAATIVSYMNVEGRRLNDGAWMALDFAERHREVVPGVLEQSRAGQWFVKNDRMDTFDFVANVGASEVVPEVVGGKLRQANGPRDEPPLGGSDGVREGEDQ